MYNIVPLFTNLPVLIFGTAPVNSKVPPAWINIKLHFVLLEAPIAYLIVASVVNFAPDLMIKLLSNGDVEQAIKLLPVMLTFPLDTIIFFPLYPVCKVPVAPASKANSVLRE